jgi:hypothetical protein
MATATLTWTPPTKRTDGTALAPDQIAGTHVFDGTNEIGTAPSAAATFTTPTLPPGDHSFTVVVHDATGGVSAASNAAALVVPESPPAPVTDLAAVLNS